MFGLFGTSSFAGGILGTALAVSNLFDHSVFIWTHRIKTHVSQSLEYGTHRREGGGILPYMGYKGMCCWIGYYFWPLCPEQGI